MTKLKIICLASLILLAIAPIKIQNVSAQEIPAEFPGRIESTGTYFEIKNSEYLNITLESAEEVKVVLESIPKMISLDIKADNDNVNSTGLIIEGLEPSKTYYKYQDSYKNGTVFISDTNGIYSWNQEINQPHHVWIQETKGTTFIGEDTILNGNITGSVEITADNITLDCNGYNITGSGTGYGIKTYDKDNITIKNCVVTNFSYGIYFYHSDSSEIINNEVNGNYEGMLLTGNVNNGIVENNIISHSYIGILLAYASNDNKIRNNIVSFNSFNGIRLWECEDNLVTENDILNNGDGLVLAYSTDNKIYHNNFINNDRQVYPYSNPDNDFDNGYPDGGNYWSNYFETDEKSGPNQNQPGSDGIIDTPYTFASGQDSYPFVKENGWEEPANQLPTVSDSNQFKSDKVTLITEGDVTTENVVVFKAMLNDPNNDQVKLQIELREIGESLTGTDDGEILNSNLVDSGNEVSITRHGLINGQYHWQARAVNSQGGVSEWQEFGEVGNVDFEVKTVPLYTQVISPYPLRTEEEEWANKDYAEGIAGNYYCGWDIANCGCSITSMIMIGRFYDIDIDINDNNADPKNINDWLNSNRGYAGGDLYWSKAIEYLGYIDETTGKKMVKLSFDHHNEPHKSSRIDAYIDNAKPIVARSDVYGHYFVIDGKLKINNVDTYTVKDPYWYNTKTLDDSRDIANHVQDYNSHFTKANLFSYLETPEKIAAAMYIYLASPAELLITDPDGKKLGRDPISGETYNDIPGSSYTAEGAIISSDDPLDEIYEKKVIYIPIPIDGSYDIQVIGTGVGDYILTSFIYDGQGESKEIIQKGNIVQDDIQEFELDYSTQDVEETETYQLVDIDIKPRSRLNIIRIKSIGVTRVTILSDQFFDAREVVVNNVLFAGASPLIKRKIFSRWRFRDIDRDGDLDLILYFRTRSLNLNSTDTEAVLTGELNDGTLIKGSDSVRVIDKRYRKHKR